MNHRKVLSADQKDLISSMVIGDGFLCFKKNGKKFIGRFGLEHCFQQKDYILEKLNLTSKIFNRNINLRTRLRNEQCAFEFALSEFKDIREQTYPDSKKSIPELLKFIKNKERALFIWFCDDGGNWRRVTNGRVNSAGLDLYTCNQNDEQQEFIRNWFYKNFLVKPNLIYTKDIKQNKYQPFLKFSVKDSLVIYAIIRPYIIKIPSMFHKFRFIEEIYNRRIISPRVSDNL